jgi:hypothetical protein
LRTTSLAFRSIVLNLLFICILASPTSQAVAAVGGETFPAGHWAYDIIEQLVVRGYLTKLYDVAKPYERMDVARAILETDKTLIEDRVTLWLFNKLEQELTDELDWLRDEAFPSGALRVGLRPELIGDKREGNFPQFQFPEERGNTFGPRLRNRFRFTLHFGENITVYNNSILQSERVFALVPSRRFAGATGFTEQAFIAYHSKNVRAKFGRDYVQWGYARNSLITNFTAGPIDHVGFQFVSSTLRFTYFLAQLDKYDTLTRSFRADGNTERYFAATRVDLNLFASKVRLGIYQATLQAGVKRPPDLRHLNPFAFSYADQLDEVNPIIGADFSIFAFDMNFYGSLTIDDWQAEKKAQEDLEPNLWAGTLGIRAANIFKVWKIYGTDAFIEFTRVRNRTFHNRFIDQRMTVNNSGRGMVRANPIAHPLGTDFLSMEFGISHWFKKFFRLSTSLLAVSKGEGNLYGPFTTPWLDRDANGNFIYNVRDGYNEPIPYVTGDRKVENRYAWTVGFFYQPNNSFNTELNFTQVWRQNANNIAGRNTSDLQIFFRMLFEIQPVFNFL